MPKTIQDRLEALAAEHEDKARAIRTTLALLNQNGHAAALDALPGKLRQAIRAEARSPARARPEAGRPPKRLHYGKRARAMRKKTAAVWAAFGDDPLTVADVAKAMGRPSGAVLPIATSLYRYGYLKKVDNGYVHTAKVFAETG